VRVEKHERRQELPRWEFPTECPECQTGLERDSGGVYIRCPNPACPAQLKQRLIYFGSRPGMDIDGLGDELVDVLLAENLVTNYADLYRLRVEQIANVNWLRKRKGKEGVMIDVQVGEANALKLIEGIDQSRGRGLARVLASISIRHVGPRVSKLLTREYSSIDSLMKADVEDLAAIHEIGDAIAESVHHFCHSEYGKRTFDEFQAVGVDLSEVVEETPDGLPLSGKSVVVTGTLKKFNRDGIKALIESLGGRASAGVSKNTDFLIAGEKAGSKLAKAKDLGVEVMTEDEFHLRYASTQDS